MYIKRFVKHYYIMLIPALLWLFFFSIVPMFGIVMAFQDYNPGQGILHSKFVGLENFKYMFQMNDVKQVLCNTVVIAVGKIIGNIIFPLIFALLLNEFCIKRLKRPIQTIVYLPYFLSWVILAKIVLNIFGYTGPINQLLEAFGRNPINFFGEPSLFQPLVIGHVEVGLGVAERERLLALDPQVLAEARNGDAFVEARGVDVECATVLDAIELERRRLGQMRQVTVTGPHQAAAGLVQDGLDLIVGHIAAHADGDLAVLVAGRHVVVILDLVRPAGKDLLAHAGLLDHLVRSKAADGVVRHVAGQILPIVGLEVVHNQAAHLTNVGVEAEHARVLVDHGTVAARGGNHLNASKIGRAHV